MSEEREILDLIDIAATKEFDRTIKQLERLVDVGDRIIAQQATWQATKDASASADPTGAEL